MKTGRRLLALLLVLAMMLSNLPVGAIAAELDELTAEATEALTETEQPSEAAPEEEETEAPSEEETEAPSEEVTEAPSEDVTEAASEDVTEAPSEEETEAPSEEVTEAPSEEETEAPSEDVTEAPSEEETEAPSEDVTEAPSEEATEPVVEEELEASEEAALSEPESYLSFSPIYDGEDGLEVNTNQNLQEMVNAWGMITRAVFWLNEYDVENGWTKTAVEVEAGDSSITLEKVEEATDCTDFYYEVTTNTVNVTSSAVYTSDTYPDGLSMNIGTWPHNFHFTTVANTDNSNTGLTYGLNLDSMPADGSAPIYAAMFHEDFIWEDVRLSTMSDFFADLEPVDGVENLYEITIYGNAREYVMDNGIVYLQVLSTQTPLYDDGNGGKTQGEADENGYMAIPIFMTPESYLSYGDLIWDEGSEVFFEGGPHSYTGFNIVPGDSYFHIYYLHTWDAEQGCMVETPVALEDLNCDNENVVIEAVEDIRDGEDNAGCFAKVSVSEWGQKTEIYAYTEDGTQVNGVYVGSNLPDVAFYSSSTASYDTFIREFYVDPDAEENAFYAINASTYWSITEGCELHEEFADLMTIEVVEDSDNNAYKITLTEAGVDAVLHGEELWPGVTFTARAEGDLYASTNDLDGLCVKAKEEDLIRETKFFFRYLNEEGDGLFFDPMWDNCDSTGLYPGDRRPMYFFLNVYDEAQGEYVEVPVEPSYGSTVVMEPVEEVKSGWDNTGWYWVSLTKANTEHVITAEVDGETYEMTLYSYPHEIALYSAPRISPDTYYAETLFEIDPADPFVFYVGTSVDTNEWTVEDVYLEDWCAEYADIEPVEGTSNFWKVTQTQAGIDQNMSQYWLDMGVEMTMRNVNDSDWVETRGVWFAYSRMELEGYGFFGINGDTYEVLKDGYNHGWFTGEYDSDDEGNTWEVWDNEFVTELPDGLSYDYDTNTLTMNNFNGESLRFEYECYDWENDSVYYNLPSDTLTVELKGENSLVTENAHAFSTDGGLNVTFTGDGSLYLRTDNNYGQNDDGTGRTFASLRMQGGTLTVEGSVTVEVEAAGVCNEGVWDGDDWKFDRPGHLNAMTMNGADLVIRDNATLTTILPDGMGRNGADAVTEDLVWDDEWFPGGATGIRHVGAIRVEGGTLNTQQLELDGWWDDDGNLIHQPNRFVVTGGTVNVQAQYWKSYNDEGAEHYHFEGIRLGAGCTMDVSGGTLNVTVEATSGQMSGSLYYEGIGVCGGELNISGDAELNIEANHESGNLLGVYCEDATGTLNITGGTVNANGSSGEGNGRSGIYLDHETEFTMTGGTVNLEYADFMNHGPVHITGGTINIGGLYWYDSMIDDRGIPYAWVTGFHAGGPEFIIDGGTINIDGGMFVANGMVGMNGGEINITNGSLQVNTAFGFDDGEINITNPGSEISWYNGEPAHIWPALLVNTYFSMGGSSKEGAAPTLNISSHDIPSIPVFINGTYHQMAGSTVNLTHSNPEEPGIYVVTQFDENGEPMYATDEEGNTVYDEEGNPIILSGSFLMNDGILNVINPGDSDAELSKAMVVDPYAFAQFRDGKTSFDTAQLFWDGEIHITEQAVIDVKDTAIIANGGHLVMDGGTLKASEESAVCLGNAEMNGGLMDLDSSLMLVNSGFHFNNGEIVINNISTEEKPINSEAVFTSLAANTYFAIGDPEDPNSNPKLTINHNLENPAVQVNGTMHLMAGSVEINSSAAGTPVVWVRAQYDENGDFMLDDEGDPIAGRFLQNGGHLVINNETENGYVGGIVTQPYGAFCMNGGTADLNGANLVLTGDSCLYDTAVLNVNDGIVYLCYDGGTGAYFKVEGGVLNLNTAELTQESPTAFYSEPGTHVQLNSGAINITSEDYASAMYLEGTFDQAGGEMNIKSPQVGMELYDTANITGGTLNIEVEGVTVEEGFLNAVGIFVGAGENSVEPGLTISGGQHFITAPDGGQHDAICYAIGATDAPVNITGGAVNLEGQYVFYGYSSDSEPLLCLADDMVLYSLEDGKPHELLTAELGDGYCHMYEDDDVMGNWETGEGFHFLAKAAIVTSNAGVNTTWKLENGILTFDSGEGTGSTGNYTAAIPAPWYWLSDFVNVVEIDSNLRSVGSYALAGLTSLSKMEFLGKAPTFATNAFVDTTTTAYYPVDVEGWTASVKRDYGGSIKWMPRVDETVEVVDIQAAQDHLFAGEKTTLNAELYPAEEADVIWKLRDGDEAFASLSVKKNVATVTAKAVTETHVITVLAQAENGKTQPMETTLTIYPKAQSVSIYSENEEVTGEKIKFDVNDEELQLTASLNPNDAEEYLASAVKWTSSSAKVATVDENGVVTFNKVGTVKITATATDGSKKKATVTITALDMVQDIMMDEDSVTELVGGKSASFTAYDADSGDKLKKEIVWSVAPEFAPYASITAKGKLSTKVVQEDVTVTIVATLVDNEEVFETHDVVIRPATTLVQIEHDGVNVTGDTIPVTIYPELYDAENLPTVVLGAVAYPDGTFQNVTWKSSSTSIAKVDENGVVTGVWNSKTKSVKTGTVTITATSTDGSKKTASVKLNFGVFAEMVDITTTENEIVSGKSMTLTAEVFPEKPTKAGILWSLKDPADKAYLTVTSKGKVKAKTVYAPVDVTLVATSADGFASEEITLTVLPKDDDILVIRSGEEYVTKTTQVVDLNSENTTVTLTAHILKHGDQTQSVSWTPASNKLGSIGVDGDKLVLTFEKAGSLTVTAKHTDGRKATVTLKAVKLATNVSIKEKTTGKSEGLTLAAGKTMNLVPTIENAGKAAVLWSVEPAGIATITSGGKLTASANIAYAQPVTVKAKANDGSGAEGEIEVMLHPQVQGIAITSLSGIENPSSELTNCTVVHDMGEEDEKTIQLSAVTFPAAAAGNVTWKSSNKKIADVDQNGKVTCLKEGIVTITATATDGSGKKASFKLKLVKLVSELTLNQPEEVILAGGKSLKLKADAGDATDSGVIWSMTGDTAYATLSAKGVLKTSAVTGPKTVYVTATAKDGSGESATCAVTIYPITTAVEILCDNEVVTGKTIEVQEGQKIILDGSSLPISAADIYEWKFSGSAAEVVKTEDGGVEVTGLEASKKTVTITCTADDGSNKKATVKIKVVPET